MTAYRDFDRLALDLMRRETNLSGAEVVEEAASLAFKLADATNQRLEEYEPKVEA